MKHIILGDTHGRAYWKYVVHTQEFDKIVFLGDYFDSWDIPGEEQIKNFQDIIRYKRDNPEKVVLLIGNHDYHYIPDCVDYGNYSGFQRRYQFQIRHMLRTDLEVMQMAYEFGNYLCTHAGVTKTWMNTCYELTDGWAQDMGTDEFINDMFKFKPDLFRFTGNDPYGDDPTQGPIWVRPQSLNEDAIDRIHIVGHTGMKQIASEPVRFRERGSGFFIDTLGTSKECLIVTDKGPATIKLDIHEGE